MLLILVHLLLKTLLRDYFSEHLLRLLNAAVLNTELPDVDNDIIVADELLLQDIVKENKNDSHHSFFVHFIFVALASTLMHAIPNE